MRKNRSYKVVKVNEEQYDATITFADGTRTRLGILGSIRERSAADYEYPVDVYIRTPQVDVARRLAGSERFCRLYNYYVTNSEIYAKELVKSVTFDNPIDHWSKEFKVSQHCRFYFENYEDMLVPLRDEDMKMVEVIQAVNVVEPKRWWQFWK